MSTPDQLVFVKLGGSVITVKTEPEVPRPEVIARLAGEIAAALSAAPDTASRPEEGIRLVLGHGSGSFGHPVAQRYGTHRGVRTSAGWRGFAHVAAAAARLSRLVADALLDAGVPVWALQPSASALCRGGDLISLATAPVEAALAHGLVPLLHGDVALDELQGGTIISTEQILAYLARRLYPTRLIMVGEVDGVFEGDPLRNPAARPIPEITAANWARVRTSLGGSHAADVTGGMLAKVEQMAALAGELPGLTVHFLSGLRPGALQSALLDPPAAGGTLLHHFGM
jgi:isopentenyl phosphate kinase